MYAFWNSVLRPALDALHPSHVLEVGAGEGLVTKPLAAYCSDHGARLTSVDIFPRFDTAALQKTHPHFRFFNQTSLTVLPTLQDVDVAFLDGDHNWHTVYAELLALADAAGGVERMPVTFVHDIGWPYGRRDLYYALHTVPKDARRPFAEGGVVPGHKQLVPKGGMNHAMFHAVTEGGERNGVGCAVDDFHKSMSGKIEVFRLPSFHGLAVVYPADLPKNNAAFADVLSSLARTLALENLMVDAEHDRVLQQTRVYELRHALFEERQRRWNAETVAEHFRLKASENTAALARTASSGCWSWMVWLRHFTFATLCSPRRMVAAFFKKWRAQRSTCFSDGCHGGKQDATVPFVLPAHDTSGYPEHVATSFHAGASSLSVIVTARNNGLFLRECLESVLHQTVKPMELIYCDDGSTDDSVAVASSVRGVTVLVRKHEGVVAARNAAVAASSGNLLLHVDGDDMLTPTYIASQLEKLSWYPDAILAYGGSIRFGLEHKEFVPPEWDVEKLWQENYINTSFLVRRDAFLSVGGWRDTVGTLWDWDLLLRLSRIGYGVRCGSILLYRRHEGSWSQIERQMDYDEINLLRGRARRAAAKVSICCVYGGRLPALLPQWFDALASGVRAHPGSGDLPSLVILDNSDEGVSDRIFSLASKHEGTFGDVTVIPHRGKISWSSEMERRHKVCMFLARAYNILLAATDSDIVWFVEDDVVVPEHAYGTLLHALTDGEIPPAAVSGLYRNRHADDWVAHHVDASGQVLPVDVSAGEPLSVDLVGTGCLMVFRPFAPHTFDSHWRGTAQAHDWTFSEKIRRSGKRIMLYPSVRCRHHSDSNTWA